MAERKVNLANEELDFTVVIDEEVYLHFTNTTLVLSLAQYQRITGEDEEEEEDSID